MGGICLILATSLCGQCPDRSLLWNRLVFLRDSSSISSKAQLDELLSDQLVLEKCGFTNDSVYAYLLQRAGVMHYLQSDLVEAIRNTKKAVNVINTNKGSSAINPRRLLDCYNNLIFYYNSLNRVADKMEAIDSLIAIAKRLKAVTKEILFQGEQRIEYLYDIGDYVRCADYITLYQNISKEYVQDDRDQSELLKALSIWEINIQLAFKRYEIAESLLTNEIAKWSAKNNRTNLGALYEQLAEVQVSRKEFQKALANFQKAIEYQKSLGDYLNCKITQNNIGFFLYTNGYFDYSEALANYRKALKYVNRNQNNARLDSFESLNIFANIANVYVRQNEFDSAFANFRNAFNQIKQGSDEKTILKTSLEEFVQNKRTNYLVSLLIDKGTAFLLLYKKDKNPAALTNAIEVFKATDQLLNRIRSEQVEITSQLFWRSVSRRLYEQAIEASLLINNPEEAFYFFEKSRAVILNDQLMQLKIGSDKILTRAQFKRKIVLLERALELANLSPEQSKNTRDELLVQKQRLDSLELMMKRNNTFYYQSFYDTSSTTLTEIQKKLLQGKTTLLELFEGDSAVYSLLITSAKIYFDKIDRRDFTSTATRYIEYLSDRTSSNKLSALNEYYKTASHLYRLIFGNHPVTPGSIIISPDGKYFPFESLVTNQNFSAPEYFLKDYAVSYAYSARYLLSDFSLNTSSNSGDFLGIAPVRYASGFSLGSLQGSDASLKEIGSNFSAPSLLISEKATRNNFLEQYARYRIIQLYTHAADSGKNGEPVIHFVDSALYLSDLIAESKPLTRLIVLSACETGNGKLYQGEGVFSFNRAFASLGIPSSIINLWSVDNESTYKITELFYKYISEGEPADIALQQAKLSFLEKSSKQYRLPYYWAPAIIAGKTEILAEKKKDKWKYIAAILLVAAALSFWGWKKARSR